MTNGQDPSFFEQLTPVAIGAALAFAVQYIVQVYIIPKIEKRKRKEARWEERVEELGELMTTDFKEAALEYRATANVLSQVY